MNSPTSTYRILLSALACFLVLAECRAILACECEPRLVIERLEAPEYAVQLEPFHLSIRVSDSVGVERVDVMFGGETYPVPAEGGLTEHLMVELSRRELGPARIEAVAVGTDGAVGDPVATSVMVVAEPVVNPAAMDPEEFLVRLDEWEQSGRTHLERYERDLLYKKPKLPIQAWDRRYAKRPTQDWVAGNLKKNGMVAMPKNWWLHWKHNGGCQPFDSDAQCGGSLPGITPNGEVLRCWLDQNPMVALSLVWQEVDPVTGDVTEIHYDNWPEYRKADLDWTFYVFYTWLDGDIKYDMPTPADPPLNMITPDALLSVTGLDPHQAWLLYTATVGHSLALEIGGFVPWSVRHYNSRNLQILFSSARMFDAGKLSYYSLINGTQTLTHFIGHWMSWVTHAMPTNTFRFFVDNDIIRSTHYYTIARILKWGRENMAHYGIFVGEDPLPMEHMYIFWQYYGAPPVVRILEGTPRLWDGHVMCWAQGCHGVTDFLVSALRNLNIPAYRLYDADVLDGHTVPVFPTIGCTMSHGDDIYGVKMNIPTRDPDYLPPEEILISMSTFVSWFYFQPQRHNVGRQLYEIAIEYLPDFLMDKYCEDQMSMQHPSELSVYDTFDHIYTYQELVDMGLWERLEAKDQKLNYCNPY